MAKTRAKGGASANSKEPSAPAAPSKSKFTLAPESTNPPKIFILPKKAKPEARIVSLQHPRYAKPTRYLACPESGIYEFTRIAAPKTTPRSWLIEPQPGTEDEESTGENGKEPIEAFGAYVTKGAELYVATPIDPLFLVLPALAGQSSSSSSSKSEKRLFLTSDDHFDSVSKTASPHFSEMLRWGNVRTLLEARMAVACDTVEAGDEVMYRLSEEKLLAEVLSKAKRMSQGKLPPSMEERFVGKALEAPVLSLKREATFTSATASTPSDTQEKPEPTASQSGASTPRTDAVESQSSVSSTDTASSFVSDASTAATSTAGEETLNSSIAASAEVVQLQRLRVAFSFLCSSYIAPSLATRLRALLAQPASGADFAPLDAYLAQVTKLRQDAVAARGMGDYSRKRVLDDEEVMERAEKKRKREEEEKRKKAGESMKVRALKKVNTEGMKKMSDFFKKK